MSARLVAGARDLLEVIDRAARAPLLALDVEGNGLFAYRSRLCTLQLGWEEDGGTAIAIVDSLALDPRPLAALLGPEGPPKVLHDLTFDARMLMDAGIRLDRVRDTSVVARMLGRKATGLASLMAAELGITHGKELQQHDWSRRPLRAEHLAYLEGDVAHLASLERRLEEEVARLGIAEEVAEECAYKLATALAGPAEKGPAWHRVKGVEALDATGRAVLRELVAEREALAAGWDLPPFKVVGNDVLLDWARRRPDVLAAVLASKGLGGRARGVAGRFLEAVRRGVAASDVPANERLERPRPDRTRLAERRARETRLSKWRRAEAAARGVDEQVVLPGHCLQDLADAGAETEDDLARIAGLGACRVRRYGATLVQLVRGDGPEPPPAAEPPAAAS